MVSRTLPLLLVILLLLPTVTAASLETDLEPFDQVLVNSLDWQDIYQGLLFAQLVGKPGDYILSQDIAADVVASLPKDRPRVLLISPRKREQYAGIRTLLTDEGFAVTELPGAGSVGLRLYDSLDIKNVIITDQRYPYNAISIAPYAVLTEAFVLFPDATTVDETVATMRDKGASVTVYGIVDAAVDQELTSFNPQVINKGGKFDNNLAIVDAFLKKQPTKQIIITNGEFIEAGLITDAYPILFIGKNNIPKQVEDYLASSPITYGVIVGNYLAPAAKELKDRVQERTGREITMIVRFGKSPRVQTDTFATPTVLEYFSLPIIEPSLSVVNIAFNRLTKQLEITYDNPSAIATFFTTSIQLRSGSALTTVGDDEPQTIVAGQQKTILYEADITPEQLSAEGLFFYGDYPNSLEYSFEQSFQTIPIIDIADDSFLMITDILYDKTDDAFFITLRNPGTVPVYANVELVDVIIDGLPQTIGTQKTAKLQPGETTEVYIRAKLTRLDLLENEDVLVRAYYGQREKVLFKKTEETMALHVRAIRPAYVFAGVVVLIIILLILLLLFTRKREFACDRCGHRVRSSHKPRRHSCGGRFRKA